MGWRIGWLSGRGGWPPVMGWRGWAGHGGGWRPRWVGRPRRAGLALFQLRGALGDRGLAVGCLVLVDDALARGLVQLGQGRAHRLGDLLSVAGVRGLAELAHRRLQRRLDGLVAEARLLVLLVALDLGLDVRHAGASLKFWS